MECAALAATASLIYIYVHTYTSISIYAHTRTRTCALRVFGRSFGGSIWERRPSTRLLGLSCPVPLPVGRSPVWGGGTGSSCAAAGPGLTPPTSAPGLRSSCPHLRRDRGSVLPHLHPDRAPPAHICPGTVRCDVGAGARSLPCASTSAQDCSPPDRSIDRPRSGGAGPRGRVRAVRRAVVRGPKPNTQTFGPCRRRARQSRSGRGGCSTALGPMVEARRTPDAHCLCADWYG